jgi:hypothetical protein
MGLPICPATPASANCPTVLACLTSQPDGTTAVPGTSRFYDKVTGTWQVLPVDDDTPVTTTITTATPTAAPTNLNVRNFTVNSLGETFEWINGAWEPVANLAVVQVNSGGASYPPSPLSTVVIGSITAPRAGKVLATSLVNFIGSFEYFKYVSFLSSEDNQFDRAPPSLTNANYQTHDTNCTVFVTAGQVIPVILSYGTVAANPNPINVYVLSLTLTYLP